jgi:hypothetical protein
MDHATARCIKLEKDVVKEDRQMELPILTWSVEKGEG